MARSIFNSTCPMNEEKAHYFVVIIYSNKQFGDLEFKNLSSYIQRLAKGGGVLASVQPPLCSYLSPWHTKPPTAPRLDPWCTLMYHAMSLWTDPWSKCHARQWVMSTDWNQLKQAFSQDSKSGCPSCTIEPAQMNNLWSNIWKTKQYSLKSGRPQDAWTSIWLKPSINNQATQGREGGLQFRRL